MAIYHFSVQVIGRSSGRSAIAAAAYRSASKISNNYDGVTHDYTKKNWVEYTDILLPENAPDCYKDRSKLWNSVEEIEKSSNAQLCRELEIALPRELSMAENIQLINSFIQDNFITEGMCADVAIHNPPVMDDLHRPLTQEGLPTFDRCRMQFINPHAHVLLTMRPIDEKGKWEPKSFIEYLCRFNDHEKAFTAKEFKTAKEEGWEKQYRYFSPDGTKIWLTPSESKTLQVTRVNRSPRTTPFGRANPKVEEWNSKERVLEWREKWAEAVNRELARKGFDDRIDHRSYEDQGREFELPSSHLGPSATAMERKAHREEIASGASTVHSDRAEINREIKKHNLYIQESIIQLEEEIAKIQHEEAEKKAAYQRAVEIQELMKEAFSRKQHLEQKRDKLYSQIGEQKVEIEKYHADINRFEKAVIEGEAVIKKLEEKLKVCTPFSLKQKKKLQEKLSEELERTDALRDYLQDLKAKHRPHEEESLQHMEKEFENLSELIKEESIVIEEYVEEIREIAVEIDIDPEAIVIAAESIIQAVRQAQRLERRSQKSR